MSLNANNSKELQKKQNTITFINATTEMIEELGIEYFDSKDCRESRIPQLNHLSLFQRSGWASAPRFHEIFSGIQSLSQSFEQDSYYIQWDFHQNLGLFPDNGFQVAKSVL